MNSKYKKLAKKQTNQNLSTHSDVVIDAPYYNKKLCKVSNSSERLDMTEWLKSRYTDNVHTAMLYNLIKLTKQTTIF